MACEFYVAEDGSIHRYPVTVANNSGNRTTTYARAHHAATHAHARTAHRPVHLVSAERIVWFWIISIIVSLLIAFGVTQGFGAEIYGCDGGFIATIGPYVVFVGALAGTILYGIYCAANVNYNLWAYILSALSSLGGILAAAIAALILCIVIAIGLVILGIAIIIGICSEL